MAIVLQICQGIVLGRGVVSAALMCSRLDTHKHVTALVCVPMLHTTANQASKPDKQTQPNDNNHNNNNRKCISN